MYSIRWAAAAVTALVCAFSIVAGAQEMEGARALTADDLLAMKTVSDPRISPDREWIAYTVERVDTEADESSTQIFMVSRDGTEVVQLTADDYSASTPRWSPDGRYLGFLAAKGDEEEVKTQVWTLDRRGGEAQQYTSVDQGVDDFAWSPDGQKMQSSGITVKFENELMKRTPSSRQISSICPWYPGPFRISGAQMAP